MRPSSVSLDSMTRNVRHSDTDKQPFDKDYDTYSLGSPSDPVPHSNQSFSADGVIPSNAEAEEFFQTTVPDSPDFDDPCLAEKSLRDIGFDYSYNMYQAKAWGYSRHNPYLTNKTSPGTTDDQSLLDDTLTLNDPDFDNTLVSSPVPSHIRSLSVPVTLHNTPVKQHGIPAQFIPGENGLLHTSTPIRRKSDIKTGTNDLLFNRKSFERGTSAFAQPSSQVDSPPSDSKPVILDLGNSEDNITFV